MLVAVISDRRSDGCPAGEGLTRFPNLIRISKRSPLAGALPRPVESGIFSTAKGTLIRTVNTIESISGNLGYRASIVFARPCFLRSSSVCAIPVYVTRPEYRAALQPRQKCLTSGYLVENGLLTRHRHFFGQEGKKGKCKVRRGGDGGIREMKIRKGTERKV